MIPVQDRTRGFTLIELLVVMSIIATLAGLAIVGVPAYFRMANKIKCADNLKQIYQLLLVYESGHKGMPTADGSAFVLGIWGGEVDKNEKNGELFFCPSTKRHPTPDLSNVTPEGIDYTGINQSSKYTGRNRISSSMPDGNEVPIVSNKIPESSSPTARKDQPHDGKGFHVLHISGNIEFIDANRFPEDLPVIGEEAPDNLSKLRLLKPGFDG
jgi:prepilin-type N-terminal cleavage/methylation domain-containing protein